MGLAYPPMDYLASCSPGAGLGLPRGGRHLGDSHKGLCGQVMDALSIPLDAFCQFLPLPFAHRDACPVECLSLGTLASLESCHGTVNRKRPWPASSRENQLVMHIVLDFSFFSPGWLAFKVRKC